MTRRDFIALLSSLAAWPLDARAQQSERLRHIALLLSNYSQTDREGQTLVRGFVDTLQRFGWTEGRNIRFEYRWAAGDADRAKASAAELVHLTPDVMLATGPLALGELHRLTSIIPIVFLQVGDPVEAGFVVSLARPGGNITGFMTFEGAMGGKWLALLKESAPNITRVAALFESASAANRGHLRAAEALAPSLSVQVTAIDVRKVELEGALSTFAREPQGGLIVFPNPTTVAKRASLIISAARHQLPAIYPFRYFAAEGGLMSYGPGDLTEHWRGAASYVDRILRGKMPSDLPIQAPSRYELVVNIKTANALGLNIPPALPLRADEVIE